MQPSARVKYRTGWEVAKQRATKAATKTHNKIIFIFRTSCQFKDQIQTDLISVTKPEYIVLSLQETYKFMRQNIILLPQTK